MHNLQKFTPDSNFSLNCNFLMIASDSLFSLNSYFILNGSICNLIKWISSEARIPLHFVTIVCLFKETYKKRILFYSGLTLYKAERSLRGEFSSLIKILAQSFEIFSAVFEYF